MTTATKRRAKKVLAEANGTAAVPDHPPGQLGDWLDDYPEDLKIAAVAFDNLKTKAETAAEKFEVAKHELNRLRRLHKVGKVRIGTSTRFIEFSDSETTRFKIVKLNKPQAVVDAERDDQAGAVE